MKCKGDTCTDSGAVSATPPGVQPPTCSKEGKNLKEEAITCKPSGSVSAENRKKREGRVGCVAEHSLLGCSEYDSTC